VSLDDRLQKIQDILSNNKAEDIQKFNLLDKEYMVDGVVVATAMADRHLDALLNFLKKELKKSESFLHIEQSDSWIVVDMGDILVHLMDKNAREKYHLEEFLQEFKRDE
jgi:ribosome silencing factor RsfS/YbeB/iojap